MKDTILRLSWIPAGVIVERQSPNQFLGTTEHGSVYERNYGGISGDCFRPVLIGRTAFGRAQSG